MLTKKQKILVLYVALDYLESFEKLFICTALQDALRIKFGIDINYKHVFEYLPEVLSHKPPTLESYYSEPNKDPTGIWFQTDVEGTGKRVSILEQVIHDIEVSIIMKKAYKATPIHLLYSIKLTD